MVFVLSSRRGRVWGSIWERAEGAGQIHRRAPGSAASGFVARAQQPPQRRRLASAVYRIAGAGKRDV